MLIDRIYNIIIKIFTIGAIILLFTVLIFYSENVPEIFSLIDMVFLILCISSISLGILKSRGFFNFLKENLIMVFIILGYLWLIMLDNTGLFPTSILKADGDKHFKIKIVFRFIIILSYISFYWKDLKTLLTRIKLKPAQSFSLGFIIVILFGAFLLLLPVSHATTQRLSIIDAIFTSTSAVCVTGLIVVDTATFFTKFGQTVILLLIQIGGLGIMTLSAFIIIFSGSKMSLKERTQTLAMLDQDSVSVLKKLVKLIIISTFVIELIAAFFIYAFVAVKLSMPFQEKIFFSIFHSISAFCNAGFSVMTDSLMGFKGSFAMNLAIMLLIFFGGIGFPVLFNIKNWLIDKLMHSKKKKVTRIQAQTKIALKASLLLIILGAAAFLILENSGILKNHTTGNKVIISFFQSVTTRTAGFNTVDIGALNPATLFTFIILMFIGASPSSTGGGIKTTTLVVLWLTIKATIKDKKRIIIGERTVPDNTLRKAGSLIAIGFFTVFIATILIHYFDKIPIIKVLFEAVSAFGTVGLSTGITASLSTFSKYVLIFLMYFGRIGPLNLLQAIFQQGDRETVVYPDEKIMIG